MASERLQVILELVTGKYKAEAAQAATATSAIGTSARTTTAQTAGMGAKMKGLATGGGGLLAIAGGAFAVKQAFDGTVGAFANFDDAMTQSLAIMGDVSEGMRKDLSDTAREVAKTTTFSADQAAESYFFLASAGFDAQQSIAAMPQVAQFAQAGMFDMALATDLATDAQSALGLKADDAAQNLENLTRVTDVFVKANILANTSVEQISEAMTTKAGAALRGLGKDVEEGSAVLAAFADQGVKGAEAGTQFSIVLRDLQTKALQNKDAFIQAGVAVFDASGEMRNIADIIGDLERALEGMSDAEKKSTLLGLGFSDKSVAAITTLLGTSDAIREYEKALRDAGGTTEEVAEKQLQSAKAQWELFLSGLQDVGIELGEKVLPAMIELLPALESSVGGVASVVDALGPLIDVLGLVSQGYTDIRDSAEHLQQQDDPFSQFGGRLTDFLLQGSLPGVLKLFDEFGTLFEDNRPKVENFSEAHQELNDTLVNGRPASEQATTSLGELTDQTEDATGANLELVPSLEAVAFQMEREAAAARAARDAQLERRDALREVHDPLFQIVSLNSDLSEAEDAVAEAAKKGVASPEYRDAVIDRARVLADLEQTLIDLKEQGIDPTGAAAQLMLADLGIPPDVISEIFAQFDAMQANFEGRTFRANLSFPDVRFGDTGETVRVGNRNYRQHGGPVEARSLYRVGEGNRPELMLIPGDNGRIFSNSDSRALIAALSGNSGSTIQINMEQVDPFIDAQRVGATASVLRRMESN